MLIHKIDNLAGKADVGRGPTGPDRAVAHGGRLDGLARRRHEQRGNHEQE